MKQYYHHDTPKYVAHVLGGAVSKKCRRLPRTEITDTLQRHNCELKCHRGGSLKIVFIRPTRTKSVLFGGLQPYRNENGPDSYS